MKKIISGMLICTVLLNSFSVIASGEELVKQKQRGDWLGHSSYVRNND